MKTTNPARVTPVVLLALGLILGTACSRREPPAPAGSIGAAPGSDAARAREVASAPVNAASAPAPAATETKTPDVTTRASGIWDAGPAVTVTGSVDGDALRSATRARLKADRTPVVVLTGGTARTLGERICAKVVPERPRDMPILLKPNIGGFDWFKDPQKSGGDDGLVGRITDPEFVRGVVRCLKARGHTRVTIAEGWGGTHQDWERLMRTSGYAAMAAEEGVPLVGMDDDGVFDVQGETPGKPLRVRGVEGTHVPTLLMPKILAEHRMHGMFISIPKLKAHRFAVFSMGIKGMQGTAMLSDASPAYRQKWRMHRELSAALELQKRGAPDAAARAAYVAALEIFAERMVDMLEIEAPDVVLVDGAPAMGGDGFGKLYPMPEAIALGGTNPILVDRAGAEYLGLWESDALAASLGGHRTSPLLEVAAKRLGVDITALPVAPEAMPIFAKARPVHFIAMAPFAIHSEPGAAVGAGAKAGPEAHAAALGADRIVVDGRGDDPAWARAPRVTFATDYAGNGTNAVTHVRFVWSKGALHALFELEGAGLDTDTSRPVADERARLYQEDCIELFLAPDANRRDRYFEVEVGPFGHFLDLAVDRAAKKSDVGWSSEPHIATQRDPAARTATIEVALSAKDITGALVEGARLPLGIYRMEGPDPRSKQGPRQYLAWSPPRTPKPDFHVPAAFGTLVLESAPK